MANAAKDPGGRAGGDEPGHGLEALRRELARGTAEMAVLALLEKRQRYGYELLRLLQETGGPVLEVKEGTLYPLLHRLEDAGYTETTWQTEGRARPRKYYSITPEGGARAALLRSEWSHLIDTIQTFLRAIEEEEL